MERTATMAKKKKTEGGGPGFKVVCANRRARYDYEIDEQLEAGVVLTGSEVKSLRDGKASLADAYATVDDHGEAWLVNSHVPEYPWANRQNHPPRRARKLLLHAREIKRLAVKLRERGFTLVPLRMYFKGARVKVEIGVGRGKKRFDKRECIKQRDQALDMRKELSGRS